MALLFLSQSFEDRYFRKFEISWAIFSVSCVLTCPVESKPNSRMIKMKTIGVVLMVSSGHRQKIAAARMPTRTPSNGLEGANQTERFQPEPWALGSVFILCFSSVRRSTFQVLPNFFRNVERSQENLDCRVWTRLVKRPQSPG